MDLWLVVREGANEGRVFRIAVGDQKTVGRDPECDIRLPDQGVSRRHCTVENVGNALHVVDLDSANGTEINGRLVYEGSLSPADRLQLGPTVLECRAPPEGVRETEHAKVLDLQCPKCKETSYTTWDWVEGPSGGYYIFCSCEQCGHRWLRSTARVSTRRRRT